MLRRLWQFAVKAAQRLQMAAASFVALGRRRATYVISNRPGDIRFAPSGKLCVFVHSDRRGEVHDYVLHYLAALGRAGFGIMFVTNAANLLPSAMGAVSAFAGQVIVRHDQGGYFGAYKDGIAAIGDLCQVDQLLLANDRLYGPFWGLSDVFTRISALHGQFWSLTDDWRRAYHLDTDFILFGREALTTPAFHQFWKGVRYVNSRSYEFRHYETGLSQRLIRAGLRGGVLCSHRDLSRVVVDAVLEGALKSETPDERQIHLRHAYALVQEGKPFDLSIYLWDYLINRMGYPFIKRAHFQRNEVKAPYISHWQGVVARKSDYDTDLVVRHLEATLRNSFT